MPRRYNSQETIEMILSAAMKLFSEKGFDKTSMQEIVEESGVSKGSIFHHFNSKEEILVAVMIRQAKMHEQITSKWLAEIKGITAKEKMITLLDRILKDAEGDTLGAHFAKSKSPQMILSAMQGSLNIAAPVYAQVFKEGIEDGSITTDYPDECAQVFTLIMNFWCDTLIFECDANALVNRTKFFQQMMKQLGADVISDELVSRILKINENYINGGIQNGSDSK